MHRAADEEAAPYLMETLAYVSAGPLWVRLLFATVLLPFAILIDCCVLVSSHRTSCCCWCIMISIFIVLAMMFRFVAWYLEPREAPLLVSTERVLITGMPSVTSRIMTAGLRADTIRSLQALATVVAATLKLIATIASILVVILEWIAGMS